MEYPFWSVPLLGGGMIIAIIAIFHVFVSHLAIGAGLFVALSETIARRRNDTAFLEYLRKASLVLLLISTVAGAITGVGIWLSIGLVHPAATSSLIHNYVWGWAIEWAFFILEITTVFMYWYTWDRVSAKTHLTIGWLYFAGAFLSMVVINGIVSFMLTPGQWLQTHYFWHGFFNPTYFPSLILRYGIGTAAAAAYAFGVASLLKDHETRYRIARYTGKWVLAGLVMMIAGGIWWVMAIYPSSRAMFTGGSAVMTMFFFMFLIGGVVSAVVALAMARFPKTVNLLSAVVLGLLVISSIAGYEFIREGVRKPYVIYGYMFSNGILVQDTARINEQGLLSVAKWVNTYDMPEGQKVFTAQCRMCHELEGYNALKPLISGWSQEKIYEALGQLNRLKPYMPPFVGTQAERGSLSVWLANQVKSPENQSKQEETVESAVPASVENRCGICHGIGSGRNDLLSKEVFKGADSASVYEIIGRLPQLNPIMPEFQGTERERGEIAGFISQKVREVEK